MSALDKTNNLLRQNIPVNLLIPNTENPNEMTDTEFNLLYDNIEKMGITDPILVRPHPEKKGFYKVIGGHHRLEVAKLHGISEIPSTIVTDESFDDDQERFQMVRHNIIHGKMSPQKFMALYEGLSSKYTADVLKDSFGFSSDEEFAKMVKQSAKALPKAQRAEFLEAAKELKTIDGLAQLLNKMFSNHGDTLPHGYMVVDFAGKQSIWLRMGNDTRKAFLEFALKCKQNNVPVDTAVAKLLHSSAQGVGDTALIDLLQKCEKIDLAHLPDSEVVTLDYLDK